MKRAQIQMQEIERFIRRSGAGAPLLLSVAYYRAPTLADELAGKCSADLLGDLAFAVRNQEGTIEPLPLDLELLVRLDRAYKAASPIGVLSGLLLGSAVGGVLSFPYGFVFGLLLLPGPVLALFGPHAARWLLLRSTARGRRARRVAYGVHLRAHERTAHWHSLTWREFEQAVADLFRRLGFDVKHTGGAGDGGIDILAASSSANLLIQCKKHNKAIGPAVVRELLGASTLRPGHRMVLVSSRGFTPAAIGVGADAGVILLDTEDLVQIHKRLSLSNYLAPAPERGLTSR